MQALFGARNAATINLILELTILAGLYVGFYYARRKMFRPHHANIQAAMVLLNLVLILTIMVPAFNSFVIQGGTTTGTVGTLMIVHAALGAITEAVALYLVFSERFKIIPPAWRIKRIKPVMRSVLALWTIVALLGVGIYYFRYVAPRPSEAAPQATNAVAPLQYQADTLSIHAAELASAIERGSVPAIQRHTEHIVNLIVGSADPAYGDLDHDGYIQDPGDGKGMLFYLQSVRADSTAANQSQAVTANDAIRADLTKILDDSKIVLAAASAASAKPQVDDIVTLAHNIAQGTDNSVPQIAKLLSASTTSAAPLPAQVESGTVTVNMKDFAFAPQDLTVKKGTTVVFVNQDNAKHTATGDNGEFNTEDIDAGKTGSFTFDQVGTFQYFCLYHGDKGGVDMSGTITVKE